MARFVLSILKHSASERKQAKK